jgi:hypothetical protein
LKNDSDEEKGLGFDFDKAEPLSALRDYSAEKEDEATRLARIEEERLHHRELERQKQLQDEQL